ncbi:similar to Saccharomyces cerevisiae YEL048C TCA17 Subunit of TRAPPII, a multimeric GEF involved in intra-Golgi and endosome-to-Golgi transport [Maudiozyma barnettii]|uniref:Similar to Saccharomyces cerevisiae YEL048C TCA17 Subunit of TRAPPII, a multimeric GEF involved in intra-Golgi and endosome-to-Golgi transport n=1 Tax=Maudiozyma barnettii TaxID=61262 RepID=A0A8H2VFL8_9SACH|nr:Tca17p [Kazachstania barnettii]CAB4254719.1 similar to Saccharomyces cerevisiae YEL048C TCA17 Subunit of TRAPPII, a multimeric GEF involved in intra-Golgi and endosome-to-Golgi transport [Kazachstania barnettii]CAD1782761.1 similar to Saccharomyces cerevisiae YEL048C TCA17 Subunit of TRAPPII, a multimeric GEF involved in intra-Golgi and endosome-to-Golgi transport [Kazachstania barnettii]
MTTIIPSFIALIADDNKPILVYVPHSEAEDVNKVLQYNTFANIALDYFDSQLFQWSSLENHYAIKSLFDVEGVSVYGMLIKPTGLKIIIGFDTLKLKSDEKKVNLVFEMVKRIYIRVKCNPLMDATDQSNDKLVESLESKFGQWLSTHQVPGKELTTEPVTEGIIVDNDQSQIELVK